jgi:hypothetical protein
MLVGSRLRLKQTNDTSFGPIMPRGVEEAQPAEPVAEAPTESAPAQPESVEQSSETKSQ